MFSYNVDEVLELRIWSERDAEAAYAVIDLSRAFLGEWLPWVKETKSPEDFKGFIRFARDEFSKESSYHLGIFMNGDVVGGISFNEINTKDNKVEIGYWVSQTHSGQGIITRSVEALINVAFNDWDMHRIAIHVAGDNLASRRVPERLGFLLDGVMRDGMRLNGTYHDLCIYSKLNPTHVGEA